MNQKIWLPNTTTIKLCQMDSENYKYTVLKRRTEIIQVKLFCLALNIT